jgi:hypothetical protein
MTYLTVTYPMVYGALANGLVRDFHPAFLDQGHDSGETYLLDVGARSNSGFDCRKERSGLVQPRIPYQS